MKSRKLPFPAAVFLMAISSHTARAAPNVTHVLQTTGSSNLTTAAWTNGTPGTGTAGDLVQYNTPSAAANLNLNANLTIGVVKLTNSGAFTINSGAGVLTMDATGLTAGNLSGTAGVAFIGQSGTAGAITLNTPITMATDLEIGATANGSTVNIAGALTASANKNLNFRANANTALNDNSPIGASGGTIAISNLGIGTGTTTLNGALGSAVASVTQDSATSVLTLAGANGSFSGPVNLHTGTLNLGNSAALGTGVLTIDPGTTLNTSGGAQTLSTNNLQQWGGDFTFTGTASLTFGSGAITLADDVNVTVNGQTLVENGPVGGGFGLTKSGAGTLALAAANTYSGPTTVSDGTFTLGGAGGSIQNTSAISVNGSATLALDNTAANADRIADFRTVTFDQNGRLALTQFAAADTTENIGTLTLASGDGIITISSAASRVTTLQADGLTRSNFATALVRGTSLGSQPANVGRVQLDSLAGVTQIGTSISTSGSNAGTAKDLAIVPWLIGDTSLTGAGNNFVTYDITSGIRPLGPNETTALTASYTTALLPENARGGAVTLANPVTVNSLLLDTAGTLDGSTTTLAVDSGAIASTNVAAIIGGGFTALNLGNGSANEGIFNVTANTLTVAAPVGVTGSGGLTKAGAGTLVLAAGNPYLGRTTVNQGILQIGNGGSTGDLGAGTADIALNGGNLVFNRTGTFTLSNKVSGPGSISQNLPGGTLVLAGNNSYSGGTTVASGATLQAVANGGNTTAGTSTALSPGSGLTLNTGSAAPAPILQLRADADTFFPTGTVAPNGTAGNVAIVGSVQGAAATIDVNQVTVAGTSRLLSLGDVVIDNTVAGTAGNTVLNVTGGNGYALQIGALLSSNRGPNGQAATFSINPTTADLVIGSIIGSTANASVVTFTGSAATTVTGSISQGLTGNRGLSMNLNQTGTVNLNGINTNGTAFAINRGTAVLNNDSAVSGNPTLGTTTASANNATLLLGGTNATGTDGGIVLSRPISVRDTDTGTLILGGQNTSGTNFFTGTITLGATANTGKSITLAAATGGEIVFAAPIVKNGTDATAGITVGGAGNNGVVTLTRTNTYAGPTLIAGGACFVDFPGSLAGGTVTVSPGALLGGTGTINGPVSVAGKIAPGHGIGTLTTGAAAISGTLEVEIDGTSSDLLVSTGNLDLTGATLALSLSGAGFSSPPYVIAQGASLTGNFANVPPGCVVTYSATQATLIAPAGGSYATWAAANGIPGEPASGDFDNDGLTNLTEYALGKNPTLSSLPPGTFVNRLLTFPKGSAAAANGDVAYTIETSPTLDPGSWTPVAPATNDLNTISYQLPLSGPRQFARLKVTLVP